MIFPTVSLRFFGVFPKSPAALHSGYWPRHDRAPGGHRGPWTSHARAVRRCARLIAAAAGVQRLVWTSIANAGLDPDRCYYRERAEVERLARCSGIPCGILRPACFFGRGGKNALIQNVAWAVRRLPCVPIASALPTSSARFMSTILPSWLSGRPPPARAGRATPKGPTGSSSARSPPRRWPAAKRSSRAMSWAVCPAIGWTRRSPRPGQPPCQHGRRTVPRRRVGTSPASHSDSVSEPRPGDCLEPAAISTNPRLSSEASKIICDSLEVGSVRSLDQSIRAAQAAGVIAPAIPYGTASFASAAHSAPKAGSRMLSPLRWRERRKSA